MRYEPDAGAGPLATAARELAGRHVPSTLKPKRIVSLGNLDGMAQWLRSLRHAASNPEPEATKAAEWLLDNEFQIRRAIRQVEHDLPAEFYARLPSLRNGEDKENPRVQALAYEFLHVSHLQLSLTTVVQFVRAYQEHAPLTIGELWALPIMFRLACLEIIVDACSRLFPDVQRPFAPAHYVDRFGTFDDTDRVARAISNLVTISSLPWQDFFDSTSVVEAVLNHDPAGVYPQMEFDTRDRYRKAIEELAAGSGIAEKEIAERVVAEAENKRERPLGHVGYWLVGDGRRPFERLVGCRVRFLTTCGRWPRSHPGLIYFGALVAASMAALALPIVYLLFMSADLGLVLFGTLLTIVPATVLGITFVHWIVTLAMPPRVLPKLNFENGIPEDCPTAVVLPVIIRDADEIGRIMERLEAHRLASPDPSLRFVLLSDFADAPEEHVPGDERITEGLLAGIRRLNLRYGFGGEGAFHLLHRPRRHNPCEDCWMGWERKRGKLEEFNRFILTGDMSRFNLIEGSAELLRPIRFVVTVDADTVLPPGAVARLAGTLAHPLNEAVFDELSGQVRSGYTIVQPRVEISQPSGERSVFARVYAGNTAIDIYSRAVSDVYQDLFGEGIYVGKGIYDVVSFQRSLEGCVPENALVSHDLFEGVHGRAALASDIVLYEDFPANYIDYTRRWHRWVRGDWQLLPWLMRRVPCEGGHRALNSLSTLDRWKVLDNLRRSLVPPSMLLLALAGWLVLPGSPWVWTLLVIAAPGAHLFTDIVTGLARGPRRGTMQSLYHTLTDHSGRWALAVVFLVHDATVAVDAIARTCWRLSVSRRHLLEWTSAAHSATAITQAGPRAATWRNMWATPVVALLSGIAVLFVNPPALLPALPLLVLWLISPEVAVYISRPGKPRVEEVRPEDRAFLRRLARRTWLYFETFVGPADNWLPPDNFQEDPYSVIAHRTSPTNIGMMFLSTLAAWDLGYVDARELAARLRNTFDTFLLLARHRGHFLNWYDTRTLEPLEPRYVSTVDSGNLAVCLIALKAGCEEAASAPFLRAQLWDGLTDTLDVLSETMARLPQAYDGPLDAAHMRMSALIKKAQNEDAYTSWEVLSEFLAEAFPSFEEALGQAIAAGGEQSAEVLHDIQVWLERIRHHLLCMQRDLGGLFPWLPLLSAPPPSLEEFARELKETLCRPVPPIAMVDLATEVRAEIATAAKAAQGDAAEWLGSLDEAVQDGTARQRDLHNDLMELAEYSERFAFQMDFRPLYDRQARLFHIGYNLSADRLDPSHYDLLASEARLASFFAIAKGDIDFEHWFYLGRPLARERDGLTLISWSGSMFEYLMPPLLLRSAPQTLLGESERTAVEVQRRYARHRGAPWGISESSFAARDSDHNYRYQAFGVSELGLRRDLAEHLVIAPYATALALPVRTTHAVRNLRELDALGMTGLYGLFEAADFTPERLPPDKRFVPVRSFMAHHQGMILAALDNALFEGALVHRFNAHANVRAIALLVQERIPWELPPELKTSELADPEILQKPLLPAPHAWEPPLNSPLPQIHTMGNGSLSSHISTEGAGGLNWRGYALTRWLPDPTREEAGLWLYVRDEDSAEYWSVGRQPTGIDANEQRIVFHPHMAEFYRRDHDIGIHMEVGVAPGADVEIRRLFIVNEGNTPRRLRFVTYGEVVLARPLEDERHPAFSKLFVGSEYLPDKQALLFTRRPRRPQDKPPVLLHRVVSDEAEVEIAGFETSRRNFIGRGGTMSTPRALGEKLTDTSGWTLDPVMAFDIAVTLAPGERRRFSLVTMAADSREAVLRIADRHSTPAALDWALDEAAMEAAHEARQQGLEPARLPELQVLCSLLIRRHAALRGGAEAIAANRLGQPRLWGFGISGDHPILLVYAGDPDETELLRVLISGQKMWRRRGLQFDLVILRPGMSSYIEPLREKLMSLLRETEAQEVLGRPGGVHLVLGDQVGEEERRLLEACAAAVLDTARGPLGEQLASATADTRSLALRFQPSAAPIPETDAEDIPRPGDLLFDNGHGGFSPDGREYVIYLKPGETTPSPWCNVLANDTFGTLVTEAGGGYTWAVNSGENRLTPWTNDPVLDPSGETLYLRDEETAEIWTPAPRPAGAAGCHEIRHGAGYTTWRSLTHQFEQKLTVFVPPEDPVKIVRLELRNTQPRARRVTATYYAEWLLGSLPSMARPFVTCGYDPAFHMLHARNSWNPDFAERVAFLTSNLPPHSFTTDRQDFLGRNGNPKIPAGLARWDLGEHVRPGSDACAAFQVHLDIEANGTAEAYFILGQGSDFAQAASLAERWQDPERCAAARLETDELWNRRLGAVTVSTPDASMDLMLNRWLLYQTYSSRVLARAGFYQAGGAYGFRDQLQDVLALLWSEPDRVRAHILRAAVRQFEEGDVLHWWHPPNDRGVRTRCSDDLLWLPYVTGVYVETTGDETILDEKIPFLKAPPLTDQEEDRYARFDVTSEPCTLFEHCERALDRGVTKGIHGLPLIGSGDWNDGMDRVGHSGQGESIWLAWFALATIKRFCPLAQMMKRGDLVERWTRRARELEEATEAIAWDGDWYLRAIYDDGNPLGTAAADECRIDSIAQSWAVLERDTPPDRARIALESAVKELVSDEHQIVRLLKPPFDKTPLDPGYIKAYPPGIRENGGQYSHAAAWLGHACARLGDGDGAAKIFGYLNPVSHAALRGDAEHYRVEPYAMAADIASIEPHTGRGGWTWYTGASAWTWRLGIEAILGLRISGRRLMINPVLPKTWGGYKAEIPGKSGMLKIEVKDPDRLGSGRAEITLDGKAHEGGIPLPEDGKVHIVEVLLKPGRAHRDVEAAAES